VDQFEVDIEEKNLIGGLDRVVIIAGVAIMALIPTLFYLIFSPKKLGPLLSGDVEPDGRRGMLLGPGAFFFFTIILTMLVLNFTTPSVSAESITAQTDLSDSAAYQAGSSLGRKVANIQSGIYDNIVDGNIWSAIIFAIPIYLFAVYLGILGRLIFKPVSDKWTHKDAMGAGLYVWSTWILIFIGGADIVSLTSHIEDIMLQGFIILGLICFSVLVIPWQYFWFVTYKTQADEGKIIPRAMLMPFVLILGMLIVLFIGF